MAFSNIDNAITIFKIIQSTITYQKFKIFAKTIALHNFITPLDIADNCIFKKSIDVYDSLSLLINYLIKRQTIELLLKCITRVIYRYLFDLLIKKSFIRCDLSNYF